MSHRPGAKALVDGLGISVADIPCLRPHDVATGDGRVEDDPDIGAAPPVRLRWQPNRVANAGRRGCERGQGPALVRRSSRGSAGMTRGG